MWVLMLWGCECRDGVGLARRGVWVIGGCGWARVCVWELGAHSGDSGQKRAVDDHMRWQWAGMGGDGREWREGRKVMYKHISGWVRKWVGGWVDGWVDVRVGIYA